MVIAGKKGSEGKWDISTYKLLDIGQSREAADRLASHDREECWEQNKPAGSTLLFKFAAMPSKDYDETNRRIVECCLRASHRPLPCGTECNQEYNRDDSLTSQTQVDISLCAKDTLASQNESNPGQRVHYVT